MKLIEQYIIPGVEKIVISTIEIYCNDEKRYFAKFKNGLNLTVSRDSLSETRIKMFEEAHRMLIHEKGFAGGHTKNIGKGLEYITNELKKNIQPEKENQEENK